MTDSFGAFRKSSITLSHPWQFPVATAGAHQPPTRLSKLHIASTSIDSATISKVANLAHGFSGLAGGEIRSLSAYTIERNLENIFPPNPIVCLGVAEAFPMRPNFSSTSSAETVWRLRRGVCFSAPRPPSVVLPLRPARPAPGFRCSPFMSTKRGAKPLPSMRMPTLVLPAALRGMFTRIVRVPRLRRAHGSALDACTSLIDRGAKRFKTAPLCGQDERSGASSFNACPFGIRLAGYAGLRFAAPEAAITARRLSGLARVMGQQQVPSLVLVREDPAEVDANDSETPASALPLTTRPSSTSKHPPRLRYIRFCVEDGHAARAGVVLPTSTLDVTALATRLWLNPPRRCCGLLLQKALRRAQRGPFGASILPPHTTEFTKTATAPMITNRTSTVTTTNTGHTDAISAMDTTNTPHPRAWVWDGGAWHMESDAQLARVACAIQAQQVEASDRAELGSVPVLWSMPFWMDFRVRNSAGLCVGGDQRGLLRLELEKRWTVTGLASVRAMLRLAAWSEQASLLSVNEPPVSAGVPLLASPSTLSASSTTPTPATISPTPASSAKLLGYVDKTERWLAKTSLAAIANTPCPARAIAKPREAKTSARATCKQSEMITWKGQKGGSTTAGETRTRDGEAHEDFETEDIAERDGVGMADTGAEGGPSLKAFIPPPCEPFGYPPYDGLSGELLPTLPQPLLQATNAHSPNADDGKKANEEDDEGRLFGHSVGGKKACWLPARFVRTCTPVKLPMSGIRQEVAWTGFSFCSLPSWFVGDGGHPIEAMLEAVLRHVPPPITRHVRDHAELTPPSGVRPSSMNAAGNPPASSSGAIPHADATRPDCNAREEAKTDDRTVWVLALDLAEEECLCWHVYRVVDGIWNFIFPVSEVLRDGEDGIGAAEAHTQDAFVNPSNLAGDARRIRERLHALFAAGGTSLKKKAADNGRGLVPALETAALFFLEVRAAFCLRQILMQPSSGLIFPASDWMHALGSLAEAFAGKLGEGASSTRWGLAPEAVVFFCAQRWRHKKYWSAALLDTVLTRAWMAHEPQVVKRSAGKREAQMDRIRPLEKNNVEWQQPKCDVGEHDQEQVAEQEEPHATFEEEDAQSEVNPPEGRNPNGDPEIAQTESLPTEESPAQPDAREHKEEVTKHEEQRAWMAAADAAFLAQFELLDESDEVRMANDRSEKDSSRKIRKPRKLEAVEAKAGLFSDPAPFAALGHFPAVDRRCFGPGAGLDQALRHPHSALTTPPSRSLQPNHTIGSTKFTFLHGYLHREDKRLDLSQSSSGRLQTSRSCGATEGSPLKAILRAEAQRHNQRWAPWRCCLMRTTRDKRMPFPPTPTPLVRRISKPSSSDLRLSEGSTLSELSAGTEFETWDLGLAVLTLQYEEAYVSTGALAVALALGAGASSSSAHVEQNSEKTESNPPP